MTITSQSRQPREAALHSRIPSLDGLRAISIGLVIIHHLAIGAGVRGLSSLQHWDLGPLGVRVFFVISGFLITGLLLAEIERTGRISLRDFYRRRTLRIFPAYYAFLGTMALVSLIGSGFHLPTSAWLHAVTYSGNYAMLTGNPSGYLPEPLAHTWSLAVEEQFYALWPAVLLISGISRGRQVARLVVVLSPLVIDVVARIPGLRDGGGVTFETNAYAIATGALLAFSWRQLSVSDHLRRPWLPIVAAPLVCAPMAVRLMPEVPFIWALALPIQAVGIGAIVAWCVRNPRSRIGRLLNTAPLIYVGTLSYSLYLWQQPFLLLPDIERRVPLNVAAAILCALGSYYLVERPILAWRDRRRSRAVAPTPA